MPFKTELKTDWIKNTDTIILERDLVYYDNRSKQVFVIPVGFISDGASIPQFLWSVMGHPFQADVRKAAVLHDFLYRHQVVRRKVADQMFYDALCEEGLNENKAQMFYAGVRVGGASSYRRKL